MNSISNYLRTITILNTEHPHHSTVQLALFAGLTYISTSLFTTIQPKKGFALAALIYLVNRKTTPIFIEWFKNYENISLVPLFGQLLNLSFSVLTAKFILNILGLPFTPKETRQILLCCLAAIQTSYVVLNLLQKNFPKEHSLLSNSP